jgi:biopolymer transport protein ExbB
MNTKALPALAAALALGAASLAPAVALAQTAPATAPATAAPATPAPGAPADTSAAAPGAAAPGAAAPGAAAPGTAAPGAAAPGTPGAPAAAPGTPDANAPAAAAPGTPAPDANAPPAGVDQGNGTEEVANPYGPKALWKNGDVVARGTLIVLGIMSLGTWYIMISKFIEQSRMFAAGRAAAKEFWTTSSVREGVTRLKENSPFRFIAENGLSASEHHEGAMTDAIDRHTWITMSVQRAVDAINSRLQGGLAFLATVGSTSPFVGLFGTVVGIYRALTAIGMSGQASIDKVAGPVGEALIMTALGLATAVPAVLGYNFLVRRNKAAIERIRNFASDVHSVLLSGSRVGRSDTTASRVA